MGITHSELDLLRQEVESWFPYTCNIYKVTGTDDAFGGRSRGHSVDPDYRDVPCSIESGAAHAQEIPHLARIENVQIFTVSMPAETDVNVGDHLVVTTPDHPSLHLHVQAELAPEDYEVERRVIATEIGTAAHA
jgi:hypothetical protein